MMKKLIFEVFMFSCFVLVPMALLMAMAATMAQAKAVNAIPEALTLISNM